MTTTWMWTRNTTGRMGLLTYQRLGTLKRRVVTPYQTWLWTWSRSWAWRKPAKRARATRSEGETSWKRSLTRLSPASCPPNHTSKKIDSADLCQQLDQIFAISQHCQNDQAKNVFTLNTLNKASVFIRRPLLVDWSALPPTSFCSSCFHSDVCVGQSQDDSIVGMKPSKQIPPALPVSGNLSSSNPDLLQSHHRILDFNNQPGVYSHTVGGVWIYFVLFIFKILPRFSKKNMILR